MQEYKPRHDEHGMPWCSTSCPRFPRCKYAGYDTADICGVAVEDMVNLLRTLQDAKHIVGVVTNKPIVAYDPSQQSTVMFEGGKTLLDYLKGSSAT